MDLNLSEKFVDVFAHRLVRRRLATRRILLAPLCPGSLSNLAISVDLSLLRASTFFSNEPDRDGGALPQLRDPVSRQMRRGEPSATAETAAEQVSISRRRRKQLVQAVARRPYHRAARRQSEVEVAGPPIAGWREQQEGDRRPGCGDRRPRVRVSEGEVLRVLGCLSVPFGDVQVLRCFLFMPPMC